MAVSVEVLNRATTADTGETQDVTGSSFTPTFTFCVSTRSDTAGTVGTSMSFSVGATDGTTEYSAGTGSKDITLQPRSGVVTDRCYHAPLTTVGAPATGLVSASHVSFLVNGHRVFMEDGISQAGGNTDARHLMEFAMGGNDLSVQFGVWVEGDSTTVSTTNKVDMLLVFGTSSIPLPVAMATGLEALRFGFGVAANTEAGISQACHAHAGHNVNTAAGRISDSLVHMIVGTDGAINSSVEVTAFGGSSGFTISETGTTRFVWVALNFNDTKVPFVVPFSTPTSTGTDPVTGTGVLPEWVAISGTKLAALNTDTTGPDSAVWSLGGYDGTSHYCLSAMAEYASSSIRAGGYADAVALALPNDDNTIDTGDFIEATVDSLDSDGFTLNYSAVASSARQCFAWGWGSSAVDYLFQFDEQVQVQDTISYVRGRMQVAPGEVVNIAEGTPIALTERKLLAGEKLQTSTGGFVAGETSTGPES